MIAIQADLLEVNNEYILNFTKILDVYVEPEDTEEATIANESTWNDKSNWTLSTAKELFSYIENDDKRLNFTQSYISIMINGRNAYLFVKRTKPTSILWFNVKDDEKVDSIKRLFDEENIVYNYNRYKDFVLNIDLDMIKKNVELFLKINNIRFKPIIQDD